MRHNGLITVERDISFGDSKHTCAPSNVLKKRTTVSRFRPQEGKEEVTSSVLRPAVESN